MTRARLTITLLGSVSLATLVAQTDIQCARADEKGVLFTHYDGVTNDLLTAGAGKAGPGGAVPPPVADPLHATAEELRRLAIYNNYRALIDPTSAGGYGLLYRPNVKADGTVTAREGLIAGDEYLAFEKGHDGHQRDHDGADTGHFRPDQQLHHCRAFVRLARRLWRHRDGRRMGPQAWLRGRL